MRTSTKTLLKNNLKKLLIKVGFLNISPQRSYFTCHLAWIFMNFHIQKKFCIFSFPMVSKQNVPSMKKINTNGTKCNVYCTCVYSICMSVHYANTTVISPLTRNFSPS